MSELSTLKISKPCVMPGHSLAPERLSTNAFIIFDQADRVERWCVEDDLDRYVLAFGHEVNKPGRIKYWIAACYECDEEGRVKTWNERYDVSGESFEKAMWRLVYRICNDMIQPQKIENIGGTPLPNPGFSA